MSCLTSVILPFLVFIIGLASANSSTVDSQNITQIVQPDPNSSERLELLRAEMSMPDDQKNEESRKKLKWIIEQVRSVEFETEELAVGIPVEPNDVAVPEPNEPLPVTPLPQKAEKVEKIEVKVPYRKITDQTLKLLKDLLQHKDQLNDPLELGEVLFFSGRRKDAVHFYEEALKQTDPNDVRASRERAWIIFQLGNCLRTHEPPIAAEMYRKLLIAYPDSPWADPAKAERELIEWQLKQKPHELIREPGLTGSQRN